MPSLCQDVLDGRLKVVAHQLTDGVAMTGKWSAKEALVKQHGVWNAHGREGFNCLEAAGGVCLLEPVDVVSVDRRAAVLHEVTGNLDHGDQTITSRAV